MTCSSCWGSGWMVVPDGGAGRAVRCACAGPVAIQSRVAASGVPANLADATIDGFETLSNDPRIAASLLEAKQISKLYVDRWLGDEAFRWTGLGYVGPPGVGKTHLAVAVLRTLIEEYGVRGRFADTTSLMAELREAINAEGTSPREVLAPLLDVEVLVLDELGAQRPTEFVIETLARLLNKRYTARRPTFFTTNYRLEGGQPDARLETRLSAPLVSRLHEMCQVIEISAPDYRKWVRRHA